MRLTDHQIQAIRSAASRIAGSKARVRVFGSRLDDTARGGDVDLMLELPEPADNPALLTARMSAQLSRLLNGRSVDVLVSAPNLMRLPIHIECPEPIENAGVFASRLAAKIQMKIVKRKIDVLYVWPGVKTLPVHRAALEQGVEL